MALPLLEQRRYTLPEIKFVVTDNESKRVHGNEAVDLVIAHTPEGGYAGTINYIKGTHDPDERRVSYHVLIHENGKESVQFVRWSRKAWHVGVHNSRSDGIALAGWAASTKALSPGGRALARAIAMRLRERNLPPVWRRHGEVGGGFCRHADIQSDRSDPMPLWRWLTLVAMVKFQYRIGGFRPTWGRS